METPSQPVDVVAENLKEQELAWLRLVAEAEASARACSTNHQEEPK